MKWIKTKERLMPPNVRVIIKYKDGDVDDRKFHTLDKEWILKHIDSWLDESPPPSEPMYSESELSEWFMWAIAEGFSPKQIGTGIVMWEALKLNTSGLFPVVPEYDIYDTKELIQLWIKTRIPTSLPVIKSDK